MRRSRHASTSFRAFRGRAPSTAPDSISIRASASP